MLLKRQLLSAFLLLCFVRVLLPEAWVLALHPHRHTTEEPAQRTSIGKSKALLTGQHKHCHEESFYDVAFQPAAPVVVAAPSRTGLVGMRVPSAASVWAAAVTEQRCLRGPPAA